MKRTSLRGQHENNPRVFFLSYSGEVARLSLEHRVWNLRAPGDYWHKVILIVPAQATPGGKKDCGKSARAELYPNSIFIIYNAFSTCCVTLPPENPTARPWLRFYPGCLPG